MKAIVTAFVILVVLAACATAHSPLDEYEQVPAATVLPAPEPAPGSTADKSIRHGKYMVQLLGCGGCHTDGALVGNPDPKRRLAGSRVGIAHSNPMLTKYPAIVFPPNLTPDVITGVGGLNDAALTFAIRDGVGRHGLERLKVMPIIAYAQISDDDVADIVAYLRSLAPVDHRVPANVEEGDKTDEMYVHFGVYRSRE